MSNMQLLDVAGLMGLHPGSGDTATSCNMQVRIETWMCMET